MPQGLVGRLGRVAILALLPGIALVGLAHAECNAEALYGIARFACLSKGVPKSSAAFDSMMSGLGLSRDGVTWKCESPEGTVLASYLASRGFVNVEYVPSKPEPINPTLLAALCSQGRVEFLGPSSIDIYPTQSRDDAVVKSPDVARVVEWITVSLIGGLREDTQCTVWYRPKPEAGR